MFFESKEILDQLIKLKKNKLSNSFQLFQVLTTIIFMKTFKKNIMKFNFNNFSRKNLK